MGGLLLAVMIFAMIEGLGAFIALVRNLASIGRRGKKPAVGDEVYLAVDDCGNRCQYFLAIRIGKDVKSPGSELWFAWNELNGRFCTVSVGQSWKLREIENVRP